MIGTYTLIPILVATILAQSAMLIYLGLQPPQIVGNDEPTMESLIAEQKVNHVDNQMKMFESMHKANNTITTQNGKEMYCTYFYRWEWVDGADFNPNFYPISGSCLDTSYEHWRDFINEKGEVIAALPTEQT